MKQVIILQGIPASGKSTWCKEFLKENKSFLRVNRDGIRRTLIGDNYDNNIEKLVTQIQEYMITSILGKGKNVIVDNTSLNQKYIDEICLIAKRIGNVEVSTKIFDVSFEECCKRNDLRVGVEKVPQNIMEAMYKNFQKISKEERTWSFPKERKGNVLNIKNLPTALMADLDGTLCLNYTRSPFEWSRVGEDSVNNPIANILNDYWSMGMKIILMSGRDSICREETISWLQRFRIPFTELHMRAKNDMRSDDIVKQELYEKNVKDKYFIEFVLDDREKVVKKWRDMNLTCLQVEDGNF